MNVEPRRTHHYQMVPSSSFLMPCVLILENVIALLLPVRSHDSVYPRKSAPPEDTVVFWPVVSRALLSESGIPALVDFSGETCLLCVSVPNSLSKDKSRCIRFPLTHLGPLALTSIPNEVAFTGTLA